MHVAVLLVALVAAVTVVAGVSRRLELNAPIVLTLVGVIGVASIAVPALVLLLLLRGWVRRRRRQQQHPAGQN